MEGKYCIGFLGADWWGSDARAVAMEFRQRGHVLIERNYEDYFPTRWRGSVRILRRLFRGWMQREYNAAVRELLSVQSLDFLIVFKGMLLDSRSLQAFRDRGVPCYCIYPDVSFKDHGRNVWECLPIYDCVFTTKSYHLQDPAIQSRVQELRYVRHGFDPMVHRPIVCNASLSQSYGCDVSFVGAWSPKKEAILLQLLADLPSIDLHIWGPSWGRANSAVRRAWRQRGAYGDETSAIYSMSKINLGLLSEAGTGTVHGDQTTARTWQIPASGGCMLHEHTCELSNYFVPEVEVATFTTVAELASKVSHLLGEPELRNAIRRAGYKRCVDAPYTYSSAVQAILSYHEDMEW